MRTTEPVGYCPFRSVIPTTQAKLGHAVTGMSERDCDGHNCMLWYEQGDQRGCVITLALAAYLQRTAG